MKKALKLTLSALVVQASLGSAAAMAEPLKVVSSFSILGDMVQQVGGDKVRSISIIGPESDAHSFEPRPSDAKTLQNADLLIINGVNFEAWLPKLSKAAGYQGPVVEVIHGVPLRAYEDEQEYIAVMPQSQTDAHEAEHHHGRSHESGMHHHRDGPHNAHHQDGAHHHNSPHHHDNHEHHHDSHDYGAHAAHGHEHGDYDPHAWQSLEHAQVYVTNIRDALVEADPKNALHYKKRAEDYETALRELHTRLLAEFDKIPASRRTVVTSHDAFSYVGQAYGVEFLSLLGASSQAEPSAKELAGLIEYMRDKQVAAVFMENISSPKLMEQIARETGAKVGKKLYSDALAKAPHPADNYLGMMKWNAEALLEALQPN